MFKINSPLSSCFLIFLNVVLPVLGISILNQFLGTCDQNCPNYLDKVCTLNGQCYKEFSNPCFLENANCLAKGTLDDPFIVVDKMHCLKPCADVYAPVCGVNDDDDDEVHIFASACAMREVGCATESLWKEVNFERCYENNGCDFKCSKEYKPVCGSAGTAYLNFYNECVFDLKNCQQGYSWGIYSFGECPGYLQ